MEYACACGKTAQTLTCLVEYTGCRSSTPVCEDDPVKPTSGSGTYAANIKAVERVREELVQTGVEVGVTTTLYSRTDSMLITVLVYPGFVLPEHSFGSCANDTVAGDMRSQYIRSLDAY